MSWPGQAQVPGMSVSARFVRICPILSWSVRFILICTDLYGFVLVCEVCRFRPGNTHTW